MDDERSNDDYYDQNEEEEEDDDSGQRTVWAILSWIALALTLIFNIILIVVICIRRSFYDFAHKVMLALAAADLAYGLLVAPFYVQNYVYVDWSAGGYCGIYTYLFTAHDLFAPLMLILLSTHVALKFSGATEEFGLRRPLYVFSVLTAVALSLLLAIPAAIRAETVDPDSSNNIGKNINVSHFIKSFKIQSNTHAPSNLPIPWC